MDMSKGPNLCPHFEPAMLFYVYRYRKSTVCRYKILLCHEVLYR